MTKYCTIKFTETSSLWLVLETILFIIIVYYWSRLAASGSRAFFLSFDFAIWKFNDNNCDGDKLFLTFILWLAFHSEIWFRISLSTSKRGPSYSFKGEWLGSEFILSHCSAVHRNYGFLVGAGHMQLWQWFPTFLDLGHFYFAGGHEFLNLRNTIHERTKTTSTIFCLRIFSCKFSSRKFIYSSRKLKVFLKWAILYEWPANSRNRDWKEFKSSPTVLVYLFSSTANSFFEVLKIVKRFTDN